MKKSTDESLCFFMLMYVNKQRICDIHLHCRKYNIPIRRTRYCSMVFERAFTHKSCKTESSSFRSSLFISPFRKNIKNTRVFNNERLEFLGDAVLGLVITDWLMEKSPGKTEGVLSRMKSYIVSRDSLYDIATNLQLQDILMTKDGILAYSTMYKKHVQDERKHVFTPLGNCVEAIIGAIYKSIGMAAATAFIHNQFNAIISDIEQGLHRKDYKSLLQHHSQSNYGVKPIYSVYREEGPSHNKNYILQMRIVSEEKQVIRTKGEGSNKKFAEQDAAEKACGILGIQNDKVLF